MDWYIDGFFGDENLMYQDDDGNEHTLAHFVEADDGEKNLMQAAPQLLEACEAAHRAFCTLIDFGLLPSRDYDPDTEYLRDKMYAAIAAAKGET